MHFSVGLMQCDEDLDSGGGSRNRDYNTPISGSAGAENLVGSLKDTAGKTANLVNRLKSHVEMVTIAVFQAKQILNHTDQLKQLPESIKLLLIR
ncbi:hypothetical protein E5288_WYG004269 [Bos mutus]|uniref:Uncharacterized protein n=1 Tax=Bos mutus TaxID=72004 RepID=A0A6B0R4A8_9CETA|nr:hypothetical protein [Bos mutus]